jgi:hypothetical protein
MTFTEVLDSERVQNVRPLRFVVGFHCAAPFHNPIVSTRRREIHDSATMNLHHSGQYLVKSQPTSAWSDPSQWRSLGKYERTGERSERSALFCKAHKSRLLGSAR